MQFPKLDYLWQYVEHWAAVDPDFPAIRYGEWTVTSGEFAQTVDQTAQAFIHLGVKKGDRIATILPAMPQYVYAFLAASKIGAITVPLDVRYRPADYRRLISHVEPKVILSIPGTKGINISETLRELSPEFSADIEYLAVGQATFGTPLGTVLDLSLDLGDELHKAKSSLEPDEGNLVVFSGGTTGVPKAALLSHRNVVSTIYRELEVLVRVLAAQGVTGRIKTLASLPPSHVGGTIELIGTGVMGGWEMFMQDRWSPYPLLELVQNEQLPWIAGVPTMYAILLSLPDLDDYDLASLKLAVLSGEKAGLELLQGVKARICDTIVIGYGSTEAGAEVTFTDPADDLTSIADGYVGKPLFGQDIKVVDSDDAPLPPGEEGEILVRGPMTIKGHYRMPEEDRAGFAEDGWCRTGDLGYLAEGGGLYITGRKKQIIRVGSYTILPTEVEEVAVQFPGVSMAAATGVPHELYGQVIWLVVVPQVGSSVTEDAIIEHCRQELADFKVPKRVIVAENLPVTRLGKVDRTALLEEVKNRQEAEQPR
jgi:acyl-CoA synthetase (AMP-forming)/AMP-acid ligase II